MMARRETDTLITVECVDQALRLVAMPTIASGGIKETAVEFSFDELWDGFALTAVFYHDPASVYHVLIEDNRCIVPKEVTAKPGYFYLGVFGVKGDVTRTSTVLSYRVDTGAITDGIQPPEPTPYIYAKILEEAESAKAIAQSVRDDADAGKFKGSKGDKGDPGAPGKDGSDAEVTSENIQSALGYAPVKDVQVAGSSVLDSGVANIKANPYQGVSFNSLHEIVLFPAGTDVLNARVSNRAITPTNLDFAVKAAMCDGKGAAWTSAEQAAARSRMGIDKPYELIEEITIPASTAIIERTAGPDGTPYMLKRVFCLFYSIDVTSIMDSSQEIFFDSAEHLYNYGVSVFTNVTSKAVTAYQASIDGNLAQYAQFARGTQTFVEGGGAVRMGAMLIAGTYINKIKFVRSSGLPEGSKIQIYGVRA